MHRSGTSLIASFLAALGVDLGRDLLPADDANPRGYWEDRAFLELQRRILQECTPEGPGHADWGWSEAGEADASRFAAYRDRALALVAARNGEPGPWGWKDPRSTLLLDFWDEILDRPAYVLVYRFPWEVADSMQRLGAEVFLNNPEYAYRIWEAYNRRLLDFHRRHRERSVLVSANALVEQPERVADLVRGKLGVPLSDASFDNVFEDQLLRGLERSDPLIGFVAATSPDCIELLRRLDEEADLGAAGLWRVPELGPYATAGRDVDLSVVIPCRDHGQFLIEAVASVQRSLTPGSYEILVVDDGSQQPRTVEVLAVLEDAGFEVLHTGGTGHCAARNHGIERARGRYVLPLDADNRLRPGVFDRAPAILDVSPEIGVVFSDYQEFGQRSRHCEVAEFDLDQLLEFNYIDACAVFRKQAWEEAGGYDETMPVWEDWELWLHFAKRGWTFDYRVRPGSLISRWKQEGMQERMMCRMVGKHPELFWHRASDLLTALRESEAARLDTEATLRQREAVLREVEAALRRTEAARRQSETARQRSEREAARLAAEVEDQQQVLGRIRSSFGWRLLDLYWRTARRLLPRSARRILARFRTPSP
jgi:hypothetical protein